MRPPGPRLAVATQSFGTFSRNASTGTAAAEVEREALLAEGDASRAQDAVTMAKKGGEIEALRAQAAGMAAALTKYATMEAAWVEEREEGARKLAKLKRERRANEIARWLEEYGPCAAWAAVDDLDLWSEAPRVMEGHAVRTSRKTGLTVDAARELVGYLTSGERRVGEGDAPEEHAPGRGPTSSGAAPE